MKKRILCIEDDATIQALVESSLPDCTVVTATTLQEAESLLKQSEFAALLVDIQLPDGDGLRFLTRVAQGPSLKRVPILILSSHDEISNKVMAFNFGADDFIAKPFDPIELNARVSAKIRKNQSQLEESQSRDVGDLRIDLSRQKAFQVRNGMEKDLGFTGIELKLLSLLTGRLEQVYSRDQILDHVWGQTFITDRTVDSHVAHIRQKIAGTRVEIETVKSIGYRAVLK